MFVVDNKPFDTIITEGQLEILDKMVFRKRKRVIIITTTQYGKSLVVAIACLILTCVFKQLVSVIAPSENKAKIIMRYFIEHLGDSIIFYKQLDKQTKLDRLRQEESKERIILRNGGGIFIISAQERNSQKKVESAMGYGADNVIIDEACLISDQVESTIYRMLAGKGKGAFYCKIGNPFYSEVPYSHFKGSWESPIYDKVFINFEQALAEGRYNQDFVDEAKNKPLFDILYGCEFPPEDIVDDGGFRKLVLYSDLKFIDKVTVLPEDGELRMGVDVGGGGDLTVIVLRNDKYAWVEVAIKTPDTMTVVQEIERIVEKYNIEWRNVSVDDVGIGRGVSDRIKEYHEVNGVGFGESAYDNSTFANVKAELFWKCKLWLESKGTLEQNEGFSQISWIKYKQMSGDKKIMCEPKERLKSRHNGKSPDYADALALTFFEQPFIGFL